jgi:hypothetical protein
MNMQQRIARKKADAIIASAVIEEEQDLADALIEIVEKHGKFNSDDMGVWAGYESAAENENREIGVTCANCILYEGGSTCKIIDAEVEPGGYCRFALIPDGIVTGARKEKSTEEMSVNCPFCANGCTCMTGQCNCPPTCGCGCRGAVVILSAASRRAPKKDRIYGSKKNKKGSASGGKKITFSAKTEKALSNKVKEHNEKAPAGRKATLGQLKAVYRRGAGAYSSSHRPGKTRDQWAMARVNAYLKLLKSGRPSNPNYKQDNDLLPKAHPKSTNSLESITASALAEAELFVTLKEENEYQSPEHAIVAFAEYSGLGYEAIPAFRAAWMRAVDSHEVPFERARELAISLYSSRDADLLPKEFTDPVTAVTAAFPGGDEWRSKKAKLQLRDRKGRFIEMGGGFTWSFSLPGGGNARATGKVVGQSEKKSDEVLVDVKGNETLKDGIYSVKSTEGESVKAVINTSGSKSKTTPRMPTDQEIADVEKAAKEVSDRLKGILADMPKPDPNFDPDEPRPRLGEQPKEQSEFDEKMDGFASEFEKASSEDNIGKIGDLVYDMNQQMLEEIRKLPEPTDAASLRAWAEAVNSIVSNKLKMPGWNKGGWINWIDYQARAELDYHKDKIGNDDSSLDDIKLANTRVEPPENPAKSGAPEKTVSSDPMKSQRVKSFKKLAQSLADRYNEFRLRMPFGLDKASRDPNDPERSKYERYVEKRLIAMDSAIDDIHGYIKDMQDIEADGRTLTESQKKNLKNLKKQLGEFKRYRDSALADYEAIHGKEIADQFRRTISTMDNVDVPISDR